MTGRGVLLHIMQQCLLRVRFTWQGVCHSAFPVNRVKRTFFFSSYSVFFFPPHSDGVTEIPLTLVSLQPRSSFFPPSLLFSTEALPVRIR